jgi:excinuclease ABC subunit C
MVQNVTTLERLKEEVRGFPQKPGVYLMKDGGGTVIYVGKARDLRSRVSSYLKEGGDGRFQIAFLMRRVETIDTLLAETERQALLLERQLITQYKPRYNIRLKDDKAYFSIRIDRGKEWPRLELVRRQQSDGADYFGPFTYSYELKQVLDVIKKVVPLRTCTDTVFYNRQRPCLEYQMNNCAGPCCLAVDKAEYQQWLKEAIDILNGKTTKVTKLLKQRMESASEGLRFEEAAIYRDRLQVLDSFSGGEKVSFMGGEDRDAFSLYRQGELASVSVLRVRNGRIAMSENFTFRDLVVEDSQVLQAVVEQFYSKVGDIPKEIIIPFELEDGAIFTEDLLERCGSQVSLVVPQRGSKKHLLGLAELNARQHFISSFDAESRYNEFAKRLGILLSLQQVPRRIECVDISNFQGSDIVGAVVCFFDGQPLKDQYRKYKLSEQGGQDDFASIHEVVSRRLQGGIETGELPDLLIIDGGAGQLKAACNARDALGIELDIVGLAKERTVSDMSTSVLVKSQERFFLPDKREPLLLEYTDELTHLVARIRDEVHRYVVTFHRSTRTKRVFRSLLDEIPGVGPERKQRLLKEYGSVKNMADVDVVELARVGRMSKRIAERIIAEIKKT